MNLHRIVVPRCEWTPRDPGDYRWLRECGGSGLQSTRPLRGEMPELRLALSGSITDHHRFRLRELVEDLERVESKIQNLEAEIVKHRAAIGGALCSILGFDIITAWTLPHEDFQASSKRVDPTRIMFFPAESQSALR